MAARNRRFRLSSWTAETTRPVLHPLVERAARRRAPRRVRRRAADAAPASPSRRCRSLLAALHEQLGRALVVLLPEDADARDAAEAARWFLGEERVALLPSRGVRWGSGLEPPPHLVGERARALDVLAAGGLVCASAAALAEPLPPPEARPEPLELAPASEPGIDALAEQLALAGYERVERVEERGQFAVRGGIVDVFPTTGREPLRIELFGDEIEAIRAFSPFTQRALHAVDERDRLSGGRAAARPRRADAADEDERAARRPGRPRAAARPGARPRLGARARCARSGPRSGLELDRSTARRSSIRSRAGRRSRSRRSGPAVAARGLAEAEHELAGFVRAGQRVVVAFPHRGEALRTGEPAAPRRARLLEAGDGSRTSRSSTSRSRRRGAASSGATSGSSCCRTRRSSASARRARDAAAGRALQSFADLRTGDYVVHEDHGIGKLLGFETKDGRGGHARLPVPRASAARTASTCRTSRSARSRATSAPTRRAPALSKLGGKAWQLLKSRARASRPGARRRADRALRAPPDRRRASPTTSSEWLERLEAEFPYRETEDQRARSRR